MLWSVKDRPSLARSSYGSGRTVTRALADRGHGYCSLMVDRAEHYVDDSFIYWSMGRDIEKLSVLRFQKTEKRIVNDTYIYTYKYMNIRIYIYIYIYIFCFLIPLIASDIYFYCPLLKFLPSTCLLQDMYRI